MARKTLYAVTLCCLLAAVPGCMEEAPVKILEPRPGAVLPGGKAVTVKVEADADEVIIGGKTVSGSETFSATVPAADGLGFVTAQIPGDDLIAVRSWHQGTLRKPADWHADNLSIQLGEKALSTGLVSVASIIAELLKDEQLAPFVKNPLTVNIVLVPATINIKSVKTPKVVVAIKLDDKGLHFLARMYDVKVEYTASAVAVFTSSGIATYKEIQVTGDVSLAPGKVVLSKIATKATPPTIKDTGGLPVGGVQALTGLFNVDVTKALADAAAKAAQTVFLHLLKEIRPTVGLAFKNPIKQETALDKVAVKKPVISLWYKLRIQAATPRVARADQKVLARTFGSPAAPASGGIGAYCGAGLVNQFGFAVWDAGNIAGISFSRDQLEKLGMEQLSFPYTQLDSATIGLLLPPLLSWDAGGPRLDIGGVEAEIVVSAAEDITAWTAASVPVKLVKVNKGLRLQQDKARKVTVREVGFDKMSDLADQTEVLRILDTAVPGVVNSVFGTLPTIEIPTLQIKRLDGSKGPTLVPALTGVTVKADHWQLELELRKK